VSVVAPLPAALAGLVLFLVPGLVFLALVRRRFESALLRSDEALFLAVGVSTAFSAWLGLVLAEAGCFSLLTAAAIEGALGLLALVLGRRLWSAPIPRPRRAFDFGPVALILVLAFALHARPTEYLFGGRDPGTYVAAMAIIGRTGGIEVRDEVVRSIPPQDVDLFYRNPENAARFMGFPLDGPESGRVVPENFHLYPAFGAYLYQSMGTRGALAAPPVFGILGTIAVFFALRRLFGDAAGFVAAALLSINVLQVWFARFPASEPMSQFLIFLGLLAFSIWEETRSHVFGALAGAVFGLSLLVRIDSVLIVVPFVAYIVLRRARRDLAWRDAGPMLVAFGALAAHGVLHASRWSQRYVSGVLNRPYWQQPAWVWIAVVLAFVALAAVADRVGRTLVSRLEAQPRRVQLSLSVVLVVLAAYAYFLRPPLAEWSGADGSRDPAGAALFRDLDANGDDVLDGAEVAAAEARVAPALLRAMDDNGNGAITRGEWRSGPPRAVWLRSFRHLAAHDAQALVRFGWFASPLGIALGVAGLLLAIHQWRPQYLFFFLLCLTFAGWYFYKMRVWHDYYFAMRRVVPVILPGLLAWAAFLLVTLARRSEAGRVAAIALGGSLAVLYAADVRPIAGWHEWRGAVAFVGDLARRFGPQDVVLFEQVGPGDLHLLSLPLWAHHHVNALELARYNPDPEKLRDLIEVWRTRYRNIYFVHTYRTDLCGVFLQRVDDVRFGAFEWERSQVAPPRRAEWHSMDFRISRVIPPQDMPVPPLPEIDVGGSDDLQVSGFHLKEGGAGLTWRWTGSCASLYFPGARAGQDLVIRASAGRRPVGDVPSVVREGSLVRVPPAEVHVSLAGRDLGTFVAGPDWDSFRMRLPSPLPPGAPVLRFDVKAWRPMNVVAGSDDTRELGVMIDRVRVEPLG
jgi:4-amino-4-deoxy-L-arabinose transferase-like glycosyltransferase